MKNYQIILISILLSLTIFIGCENNSGKSENADKPNVIFVFTDDLGYGDVTSYNSESKVKTPNIDRIASEGMKFTDAHTSSAVCTPSRYSLLTGRYCWRTSHKRGVFGGYNLPLIDEGRMTLGSLFQKNGYKTAAIGKWHVGMEWTLKKGSEGMEQEEETVDHTAPLKITPVDQGFDYFFGTSGCTSDDGPFAYIENKKLIGNPLVWIENLNVVGDGDYLKDVWAAPDWEHEKADLEYTNKAIEFMGKQVEAGKPFFVYLPLSLPHIPWLPADIVKGTTDAGPREELVALADYCVGELDKALKKLGVDDNTIFIFSSDNGPRQGVNGHKSAGLFRGYKGQIFEGGHRVPLVIRWPGKVKPASTCDETVCMTDFMATFAAILESPLPENAGEDSYNMTPLLLGAELEQPFRESTVHHSGAGAFAIRKGDWKIIFGKVRGGEAPDKPETWKNSGYLFNMKEDPYETTDVYEDHPELVAQFNSLLDEYLAE